jgi:phosphopantothenoylcysteine decarboxylase/phosphopantothenate--cysteine ligase
MRCLVTAGPTWEPIDGARRITNFSTGTLGGRLANYLASEGHDVTLFLGQTAIWNSPLAAVEVASFSTTASLSALLEARATSNPIAVFHAAAVSDFCVAGAFVKNPEGTLEPVRSGKHSTRAGNLWLELQPTPKIISHLREWFPNGRIVGWKYEVDCGRPGILAAGASQLMQTRVDHCVLNGPAYGPGFGLLTANLPLEHLRPDQLLPRLAKVAAA